MPAAGMPRHLLNILVQLLLFKGDRFSVLPRFWTDSFFICGIKFLSLSSGPVFSVLIRIHTSNIDPFRPLRLLNFLVFEQPPSKWIS